MRPGSKRDSLLQVGRRQDTGHGRADWQPTPDVCCGREIRLFHNDLNPPENVDENQTCRRWAESVLQKLPIPAGAAADGEAQRRHQRERLSQTAVQRGR